MLAQRVVRRADGLRARRGTAEKAGRAARLMEEMPLREGKDLRQCQLGPMDPENRQGPYISMQTYLLNILTDDESECGWERRGGGSLWSKGLGGVRADLLQKPRFQVEKLSRGGHVEV